MTTDLIKELAAIQRADCNWHTHSMFVRCVNGLTLREYVTRTAIEGAFQAGGKS